MKYWKQGFYDEPVDGSVEITDEYYNQLLAGQSAGLLINESKKGYPILIVHEVTAVSYTHLTLPTNSRV